MTFDEAKALPIGAPIVLSDGASASVIGWRRDTAEVVVSVDNNTGAMWNTERNIYVGNIELVGGRLCEKRSAFTWRP